MVTVGIGPTSHPQMNGRILLVDDEVVLLSAMSDYLTTRGYECDCATEGAEAMALLAHVPFDVVITDVDLSKVPRPDGLDVVSFIRDRALTTRIIVLTGRESTLIEGEARRLSADLFLRKPVPLMQLADAVASFMDRTR
jgi:DNA-binding response OmpR family regulator